MCEHIRQLQAAVLKDCQHYVKAKGALALQANNLFWQQDSKERQEYHPFIPHNVEVEISRLPNYVKCIQQCAKKWI